MTTAMAMPGNTANVVLVHFFGGCLAGGEIRPWPGEAPATGKGARRRGGAGGGHSRGRIC